MTEKKIEPNFQEINIRVKDQDGGVVCFRLKKTTKLKKLMENYCMRQGYPLSSVRFIFEGNVVKPADTPLSLQMENDEEIDAMIEQHGGTFIL